MRTAVVTCLFLSALPTLLASQQKATSVASTLERLEREYISVPSVTDTAAGRRLVESNALVVNLDGGTTTGENMLRAGWSGDVVFDSLTVDSVQVRQLAPTVALVYARGYQKGHYKAKSGTKDLTGQYQVLDVWRLRNGHWRVASEMGVPVQKS
jgi:hypothetical protein